MLRAAVLTISTEGAPGRGFVPQRIGIKSVAAVVPRDRVAQEDIVRRIVAAIKRVFADAEAVQYD
jgi:hypothetical protein